MDENGVSLFPNTITFNEEFVNLVGTFLFLFCDRISFLLALENKVDSILRKYNKKHSIYRRSNHNYYCINQR